MRRPEIDDRMRRLIDDSAVGTRRCDSTIKHPSLDDIVGFFKKPTADKQLPIISDIDGTIYEGLTRKLSKIGFSDDEIYKMYELYGYEKVEEFMEEEENQEREAEQLKEAVESKFPLNEE